MRGAAVGPASVVSEASALGVARVVNTRGDEVAERLARAALIEERIAHAAAGTPVVVQVTEDVGDGGREIGA
jgi:hypothetical protein